MDPTILFSPALQYEWGDKWDCCFGGGGVYFHMWNYIQSRHHRGQVCLAGISHPLPSCVQDKWLLHSVLMLVQSWIKPLVYLQTTMARYDYASDALLNKTKWVLEKLLSLEQGVVVLIKKVGFTIGRKY